jgi:hypothetical protein
MDNLESTWIEIEGDDENKSREAHWGVWTQDASSVAGVCVFGVPSRY